MTARRPKALLFSFAFVLLILPGAQAQAPLPPVPALAITGQLVVQDHQLVELTLTGGEASTAWLVIPTVSSYKARQTIVFTAPPGNYDVICLAVSSGQPVILQTIATIASTPGPAPTPPPGPSPAPVPPPTPPPTPVSGPLWAIAIFDTSKQATLPAGQLGIWVSQTLQPSLSGLKVYLRRVDINNPSLSSAGWQKALTGLTPPILAIVDSSANVSAQPMPANETAFLAAVKTAQGVR
jgi:hypothetical protein